jgi:type II secretory pathway predicted ATPase ExeA
MEYPRTTPLAHWGFARWPFPSLPDAAQFYPTAGHDEALARVEYLVDTRRRLGALVGLSGTGKSLLLEVAARRLARAGRAVVLVNVLGMSTRELLWQIAAGLGTSPREDADLPRLWRQIADRIAENRMQRIDSVLLVDDAGQAGPDVLTQLVRLARLDASPAARWTIVLAAEARQAAGWNATLRELVDLRIDVEAWEEDDTVGFVQNALVEAGSSRPLFNDDALAALHRLSGGNPRRVTRLADFALLAGAATGAERIDTATVRAAWDEVAWPEAVGAH